MTPTTAPAPSVEAAKAESVEKYLEYRRHYEGCWRAGLRLFCMNCEVLELNSSAADWKLAQAREASR